MRRRLVVAIGGAVVLAVVVVGLGTLLLTRLDARNRGEDDLAARATALAEVLGEVQPARVGPVARRFRDAIGTDTARIVGLADPPPWLDAAEVERLRSGGTTSGRQGDTLVAAAGLRPTGEPATRAVVLVDSVDTGTGTAGRWFVVAGLVTVLAGVAAAVAVARSLSGPLVAASGAADRIAAGDLAVRLPDPDAAADRTAGPGADRAADPGAGPGAGRGPGRRDDELARLARSVNAMAASLQQARRAEREFLLSVSHDLRTPLTAIGGWAEALADGAAPDPAAAGERIRGAAGRLDRLVGDLLDLARLRSHAFTLAEEVVDLGAVAAGTAEGLRPDLEDAGLTLSVDVPPGPALVRGDPDRLAQIVANLLDNATRHAATHVTVEVVAAAGVTLAVTDDGPGIPPADRAAVFARLHTDARPAARTTPGAGSGLGLAIVAELAHAMSAHAAATTPPTATPGARLTVTFPAPR